MKLLVTATPYLKIFTPNLKTRLKIDASSEHLDAVLEQNHKTITYPKWYLIGYASGSLRDYKKQYAQIEKEIFSVVFGMKRFH